MNKKKKGPKEGKILVDPETMTPEKMHNYHFNRQQQTDKLVATMTRALLDPYRSQFVIGTIGLSVAARHDNCHYNSYATITVKTPPIRCSL